MQGRSGPSKAELFELIIESAHDFAIFSVNQDGQVTTWNSGATRLFGFNEEDMLGRSGDAIFTPEDVSAKVPELERSKALREGRAQDERWHQRKDGSRFWASGFMMRLRSNEGGFVKIARDRTEQHTTNELLRQNEERFRLLATSIPQLVFRTLPDGNRTWGSPQWIEFTGLSLEDSLGKGWMNAIHPEDRKATDEAWDQARHKGEYYVEHRVRFRNRDEYRWHQTRARPIEQNDSSGLDWVGTMTDIHDLRGLTDRQNVLVAELQHRTRNLLAVVQSIASQTARNSSSLQIFQKEFESRLRALGRVQSVLSSAKNGAIELSEIVVAQLAPHEQHLETGKIAITGPNVCISQTAAQALGLALHELATNAVKYGALQSPIGKLTVDWKKLQPDSRNVALEWRETGVPLINDKPARTGYGSKLILDALPYQLGAKTQMAFERDGLRCCIVLPTVDVGVQKNE